MYFIFNIVLCAVKLQVAVERNYPNVCIIEAVLVQFSYLSTICWFNTMCVDVWIKFRNIKMDEEFRAQDLNLRNPKVGFKNPKFKWYLLYATGVPFIVSGITLIIHCLPQHLTKGAILPFKGITKEQLLDKGELIGASLIHDSKLRCFFDDNWSTLLYFFVITGPILLYNLLLFVLFARNLCFGIWSQERQYSTISGQSRNLKRLTVMFFALGIPWLVESLGFLVIFLGTFILGHESNIFNFFMQTLTLLIYFIILPLVFLLNDFDMKSQIVESNWYGTMLTFFNCNYIKPMDNGEDSNIVNDAAAEENSNRDENNGVDAGDDNDHNDNRNGQLFKRTFKEEEKDDATRKKIELGNNDAAQAPTEAKSSSDHIAVVDLE